MSDRLLLSEVYNSFVFSDLKKVVTIFNAKYS